MRLDVFGREIEVVSREGRWQVYYIGAEGKKRLCDDISIPAELPREEIPTYVADLCHEWAKPGSDSVRLLKRPDTHEA